MRIKVVSIAWEREKLQLNDVKHTIGKGKFPSVYTDKNTN